MNFFTAHNIKYLPTAEISFNGRYREGPNVKLSSGNIGIRTKLAASLEHHSRMRVNRVNWEARVKRKVAVMGRSFGCCLDWTAFWMMKLALSYIVEKVPRWGKI